MTNKNPSLTLLLLIGMLLGYTSCMSRNPETSSQGQHTATTSRQGPSGTAKVYTTVDVEKALPNSLINKVWDSAATPV